jgi:uncharacterized membrane protein YbhN (UPF0104 family)
VAGTRPRSSTRTTGPPRLRPERVLLTLVAAIALVVGVTGLVGRVTQFSDLRHALHDVEAAWLPLALVGLVGAYVGYIFAYRAVAALHGGPCFSPWTVLRVVGIGFGAFAIGSTAGGLAVDFWALHKAGCSTHESLQRVLGLNTLQWAVLGLAAVVAALLALAGLGGDVPLGLSLAWLVVVPLCFAAGAYVSAPGRIARFSRLPDVRPPRGWRPATLARWLVGEIRVGLADAIGGLTYPRAVLAHPLRHVVGATGYPLYWAGHLLALYASLRAFGQTIAIAGLVLAYATGYIANALPLPAGGAGGVDASLALTLTLVGIPLAPALLAALVYRGFTFWLPVLPALGLLATAPRLAQDLEAVADRRAAPV